MARLILCAALILGTILAMRAIYDFGARVLIFSQEPDRDNMMPPIVKKCAYVALIVIMFGAASGGLGGF